MPTGADARRGSALLTVLWLTAALSAIGVAVASNVRGETERAATYVDDARAYFLATGAIDRAVLRMTWGPDFYRPGTPSMDLGFPAGSVHVDIIPETSKLNLNAARPLELARLLVALGMAESEAVDTAGAMIDWRTPDPLHQSPFDGFYLTRSPSFLPPHASFSENEELLLVKGITPDFYYGSSLDRSRAGLRDCVSVFGSAGAIDVNTAQPETMQAIGLSPADAAGVVKFRSENGPVTQASLVEIRQSVGPPAQRLSIGGQTIFTIRATARVRQPDGNLSDLRRTVAALVHFSSNGALRVNGSGIDVLRWFDR